MGRLGHGPGRRGRYLTLGAETMGTREVVFKVGAEGGSLCITRERGDDGRWVYQAHRNETALIDLLGDEADGMRGLADCGLGSGSVEAALRALARYPWPILHPLRVHRDVMEAVLEAARTHRRGSASAVATWERIRAEMQGPVWDDSFPITESDASEDSTSGEKREGADMPTISPDAIDRTSLALSVRQPYVTRILNGTKRFEYRSQPTNVRGRVLLYASATIDYDSMADEELPPPEPPTKVIVGDVEIVGCEWDEEGDCYAWALANPRTLSTPLKPFRRANPVWFRPWGEDGRG